MKKTVLNIFTGSIILSSTLFIGCTSGDRADDAVQPHDVKEFRTSSEATPWSDSITISGEVANGADYLSINMTGTAPTLTDMAHLQVYVDIDNNKATGYSNGPIVYEGVTYNIIGADYMIEDDQLFKSTSTTNWEWQLVSSTEYNILDADLGDGTTEYNRKFKIDLNLAVGFNNSDVNIAIEPVDVNWVDTNNFIPTHTISVDTDINKPDLSETPMDELTNAHKYALAYMWHEEKLAYDIYLELNKVQPANQFVNIANNSEIKHIAAVEELVAKYDINITNIVDYEIIYSEEELRAMPTGKFAIPAVQALYDTVFAYGEKSPVEALQAGCMVEVVDIVDLDAFIVDAEGKQDLIDTFEYLKAGSYKHYWGFDNGLKSLGVENGCCSTPTLADHPELDFCQPDYPQK